MKIVKKLVTPVLLLLLIVLSLQYSAVKFKNETLQKNADNIFYKAISDTMDGLGIDYSKSDEEQKMQAYYQIMSNLHDAMEVFYITSYNDNKDLYNVLNSLYSYLLERYGTTDTLTKEPEDETRYEIEDGLTIYEYLGKIMVYPIDKQKISDFNRFLDEKESALTG